jgi:hypothetical protein
MSRYSNEHYVPLTLTEKVWLEFKRPPWDWQLYDERGRLVWASELARRYRRELKARENRDYREKEYKKNGIPKHSD